MATKMPTKLGTHEKMQVGIARCEKFVYNLIKCFRPIFRHFASEEYL